MQGNLKHLRECFLIISQSDPRNRISNMVASGV
jgi:hypothetical protein